MSFKNFEFHPHIQAGITACGYTRPTPIQTGAIGPILDGKDVLGLAQTGTGKTAAFVLPLLQRLLNGPRRQARVLILAPTRELALQIHENIETMAQKAKFRSVVVYGGVGKGPQVAKIRAGAEFIVACPGRLIDLLNAKSLTLDTIEALVLDEADQMFDKGFLPDIKRIIKRLPGERQTLVFSATMPKEIRKLTQQIMDSPETIQIANTRSVKEISHNMIQVKQEEKTALLKTLVQDPAMTATLVFTRTKHKARKLARQLTNAGFNSTCLQGNLSQNKRQKALDGFKDGTFSILVATDIAARGIDVSGISHVINYDVPDTAEAYIHRTGRTGRAKQSGKALSFVTEKDSKIIRTIERNMGQKIQKTDAPDLSGFEPSPPPPAPPLEPAKEATETIEAGGVETEKPHPRRHRPRPRPRRRAAATATSNTAQTDTETPGERKSPPGRPKAAARPRGRKPRTAAAKPARATAPKRTKAASPKAKAEPQRATAGKRGKKGPAKTDKAAPKAKRPAKAGAKPQGRSRARDACPMPLAILGNKTQ